MRIVSVRFREMFSIYFFFKYFEIITILILKKYYKLTMKFEIFVMWSWEAITTYKKVWSPRVNNFHSNFCKFCGFTITYILLPSDVKHNTIAMSTSLLLPLRVLYPKWHPVTSRGTLPVWSVPRSWLVYRDHPRSTSSYGTLRQITRSITCT